MRTLAIPATAVMLAVAACSEGPANPLELAPAAFDAIASSAPANDGFSGATLVTVPFAELINTTAATTDADDAQLNASCGAPATDASVWYVLTPETDMQVVVDVSQSDYAAGIAVGVGSPGNLSTVTCGAHSVLFSAAASTPYYVLAFDDQLDGVGIGGFLSISFNEIVATALDAFTVNPSGSFDSRSGIATISGTYACSGGDSFSGFVDARQTVGRFTILGNGAFFASGTCDGASHPWTAEVIPQNGKFAGGKAMTVAVAFACGTFSCADGYVEQTVHLRGGSSR